MATSCEERRFLLLIQVLFKNNEFSQNVEANINLMAAEPRGRSCERSGPPTQVFGVILAD